MKKKRFFSQTGKPPCFHFSNKDKAKLTFITCSIDEVASTIYIISRYRPWNSLRPMPQPKKNLKNYVKKKERSIVLKYSNNNNRNRHPFADWGSPLGIRKPLMAEKIMEIVARSMH